MFVLGSGHHDIPRPVHSRLNQLQYRDKNRGTVGKIPRLLELSVQQLNKARHCQWPYNKPLQTNSDSHALWLKASQGRWELGTSGGSGSQI